jgi:hypothetical protein
MIEKRVSNIPYGDEFITASLPERTKVLQFPEPLPALENPEKAVKEALYSPIAHDPISKLVGPASRVTVAFDDPVIPQVPIVRLVPEVMVIFWGQAGS